MSAFGQDAEADEKRADDVKKDDEKKVVTIIWGRTMM